MILENKYFIKGNIKTEFIADEILIHQTKTNIGGHSIFLGQVRDDDIDGKRVIKIIYTAYKEMAEKEISRIREFILNKYELRCLHIYHSLGEVNTGEISFFVFGSASHRTGLFEAVSETVEMIKKEAPIWKQLIFN